MKNGSAVLVGGFIGGSMRAALGLLLTGPPGNPGRQLGRDVCTEFLDLLGNQTRGVPNLV